MRRERYEDALICLAFENLEIRRADAAARAAESAAPLEADVRARLCARARRDMRRAFGRRAVRRFATRTLPRLGVAAAAVLLIGFIGLTTAIAANSAVRVRVMRLLVRFEDEYAALNLVEDEEAAFAVPALWNGHYYPTYIPEGFSLVRVDPWVDDRDVYYQDAAGRALFFSEMGESASVNIDTENAEIDYIDVNGNVAMLMQNAGINSVAWVEGGWFLLLRFDGDVETAVKIARSVKIIS